MDRRHRQGDAVCRLRRASTTTATARSSPSSRSWSFEERKSEDVYEGVDDISLAADGSTVLVRNDKVYK